jgi:hypothetical protein
VALDPVKHSARDRVVVLMTRLLERFTPRSDWRHTDVEEVVDALIEAAREPVSAHTRALAEERDGRSLAAMERNRLSLGDEEAAR